MSPETPQPNEAEVSFQKEDRKMRAKFIERVYSERVGLPVRIDTGFQFDGLLQSPSDRDFLVVSPKSINLEVGNGILLISREVKKEGEESYTMSGDELAKMALHVARRRRISDEW